MSDEDRRLTVAIEAVNADTIQEAERLLLKVEGDAEVIQILAAVVIQAVGGDVMKATTYSGDGPGVDITEQYLTGPAQIDPLSTGDGPGEA